ncbi:MAG: DegT/DnrJ/EryC1/StrS family aminotransferase [Proteobacteria bacterium]|nr:DegT/DnrJ/EryC1/StrS family aminotransferase [Pseudomonadota bacterium]
MSNKVPFLDLVTPHLQLEDELVEVCRDAIQKGWFIGGPNVSGFEEDFAKFCDARHAVGVGSGTDALRFALMAAGVQKDDIVVTVPNTFIATTEAISQVGALPDFVDVDEETYNLDPDKLRQYIGQQCTVNESGKLVHKEKGRPVTAVIPVHLYGRMADMDPIMEIADEYKLIVVEDACQAHGAEYYSEKEGKWKKAGSIGHAAAFSFYPGKNLGACGEGGAATTNDEDIDKKIRMIRDHGQAKKYYHDLEGYNGRLDAMQAGMLRVKLRHLPEWTGKRQVNAAKYNELLNSVDSIDLPLISGGHKDVYHLYVIHTDERDGMQKSLADNEIFAGLHYPVPLHLQKAYEHLGFKEGDFPASEKSASRLLSLPMFPELTEEQQKRVAEKIRQYLSRATKSPRH